ncbi:MAG TPA: peptide-methionine (S)-S-oxide reductase MsrA [Salinivirga sp.]|uniref:peptide-methionine (S)-S-oxide reductase MsrA n=1 Tax=Salinivirga sp. TaxID=1970192 RepID=UPI002B48E65A|nr:peptide-methionine (S)-S-oxide reductase MsrA [Salinivirga sp.]HKK60068.1 peptide-methionine (S)-S-oxide reductase MsrA [Salinivirga sp.]
MKSYFKTIIMVWLMAMSFTNTINANNMSSEEKTIVLGGGCFWCIEAVFNMTKGVSSAVSGYAGGHTSDPSYQEVTTGSTGHAEVVKITYNPETISLEQILDIFFTIHDPTQLNRQGADIGTQYRSAIYYTNQQDRKIIDQVIEAMNGSDQYDKKAVTEVKPLDRFYKAEVSHQDYYEKNEFAPYCSYVIKPKVRKFKTKYPDLKLK